MNLKNLRIINVGGIGFIDKPVDNTPLCGWAVYQIVATGLIALVGMHPINNVERICVDGDDNE